MIEWLTHDPETVIQVFINSNGSNFYFERFFDGQHREIIHAALF
jgi:hypothetical protein